MNPELPWQLRIAVASLVVAAVLPACTTNRRQFAYQPRWAADSIPVRDARRFILGDSPRPQDQRRYDEDPSYLIGYVGTTSGSRMPLELGCWLGEPDRSHNPGYSSHKTRQRWDDCGFPTLAETVGQAIASGLAQGGYRGSASAVLDRFWIFETEAEMLYADAVFTVYLEANRSLRLRSEVTDDPGVSLSKPDGVRAASRLLTAIEATVAEAVFGEGN
jgi:hypothetical protein